jgi:hypothetical protein
VAAPTPLVEGRLWSGGSIGHGAGWAMTTKRGAVA